MATGETSFSDVTSGFLSDGRLATRFVVENRTSERRMIQATHLAEARPSASGDVIFLDSVLEMNVVLDAGAVWQGDFAWNVKAAARARALGEVLLVVQLDQGPPIAAQIETGSPDAQPPSGGSVVGRLRRWFGRSRGRPGSS